MMFPCHAATSILLAWRNLQFPITLSFTDSRSECVLDIVMVEREVTGASPVHISHMNDFAIRSIKRFPRSKRKDDIKTYVDKNFTMDF
jgi:hypothetical protein